MQVKLIDHGVPADNVNSNGNANNNNASNSNGVAFGFRLFPGETE